MTDILKKHALTINRMHSDTERLNAIEDGCCLCQSVFDGNFVWTAVSLMAEAQGDTMREAIDNFLDMQRLSLN